MVTDPSTNHYYDGDRGSLEVILFVRRRENPWQNVICKRIWTR
jgi:hypothetical protein